MILATLACMQRQLLALSCHFGKTSESWPEPQHAVDITSVPDSWRECGWGYSELRRPHSERHFQGSLWECPGILPRRDAAYFLMGKCASQLENEDERCFGTNL